ncbi:hypothetical protein K490DRAFT_58956 [Saccharata proteae CBS 121410]|uniref:Tachykinin family protein n=1 Tax=Saccharata proteae CBS 121410 TaxID=1314787 RepID=A0A9P4HTQ3_9PEZI|nr:hypothetical protein K490DRAFT_58956 [Saccharata proteae CBS 121410]
MRGKGYGGFQPPASNGRLKSSSKSPTGPKTFVFVTATEPKQFNSTETMRNVRSTVMHDVIRRRGEEPKAKPLHVVKKYTPRAMSRENSKPTPPASSTFRHPEQHPANPPTIDSQTALKLYRTEPKKINRSIPSLSGSTPGSSTTASSPKALSRLPPKRPRTIDSFATTETLDEAEQILVQPSQGSPNCRGMNEHFYLAYPTLGPVNFFSPYDPFYTLPRPSNTTIDVERLKWHCHNYFGTRAMAHNWLPQAINARESFLSTLCISSTHEDAMAGVQSHVTVIVNTEVLHIIRERLSEKWSRVRDSTIMSVAHLLCSRLVSSNERERAGHEDALRQLIDERGGMKALGLRGELAAVSTAMVLTSTILREASPHPTFLAYASTLDNPPPPPSKAIPESPIYRPRDRFYTLERSKNASPVLLDLVYHTRSLTELCLATPASPSAHTSASIQTRKEQIRDQVRSTPSQVRALGRELDAREKRKAWRAEAVRLASLLYAEAVAANTPFSSVARLVDPTTCASTCGGRPASTTASTTASGPTDVEGKETILSALHNALKHSGAEYSDCWADLTGVLFWVTLVAGAVARFSGSGASNVNATTGTSNTVNENNNNNSITTTPNGKHERAGFSGQRETAHWGSVETTANAASGWQANGSKRLREQEERQRKWFIALNVRCAIVLAFEHRVPVVRGLEGMVGVVGALGRRGMGRREVQQSAQLWEL